MTIKYSILYQMSPERFQKNIRGGGGLYHIKSIEFDMYLFLNLNDFILMMLSFVRLSNTDTSF